MFEYTQALYEEDLATGKHAGSIPRFRAFYERLGTQQVQKDQKYIPARSDWIHPKGRVIELGCHVGFNLVEWACRPGIELVVGLDLSGSLLRGAAERVESLKLRAPDAAPIYLVQGLIEELPVVGEFDTVVLTETLEHVRYPFGCMVAARSLMGVKSILFVSAPSKRVGTFSHLRGISRETMEGLLIAADLQPIRWVDHKAPEETACMARINLDP
jgi:2-polyprenyl-3-methyl-5-hydroxy-6-metoxy-1,4-benzoquinol methylase